MVAGRVMVTVMVLDFACRQYSLASLVVGHVIRTFLQSAGHLNNFELEPQGLLSQGQEPGILDICKGLIKDCQQGLVVGHHEQIWLV